MNKIHPNARPPKAALKTRPEEQQQSLARLQKQMGKYLEFAVEVSCKTKAEMLSALVPFQDVTPTFFIPQEYISLVGLRITNAAVLKELLNQDWILKVDFSELTFGNPALQ